MGVLSPVAMASEDLKVIGEMQGKDGADGIPGGAGAESPADLQFSVDGSFQNLKNHTLTPHLTGDCSKFTRMDKFNLVDRSVYEVEDDELRVIPEVKEFILMGGVIGPGVLMKEMQEFIAQYWNIPGVIIQGRKNGVWSFQFGSEDELASILDHDTWLFKGLYPIALQRWEPGMNYAWKSFTRVPAWVRLRHLNPQFMTERLINVMGNMIGEPISVDNSYLAMTRPDHVRMLISVSAEDILKDGFVLKRKDGVEFKQRVWYEWVPHVCDSCKVFGHLTKRCKVVGLHTTLDDSAAQDTGERPNEVTPAEQKDEEVTPPQHQQVGVGAVG